METTAVITGQHQYSRMFIVLDILRDRSNVLPISHPLSQELVMDNYGWTTSVEEMVAQAYNPDECEQCEMVGETCWECAADVVADLHG
jgi:hypothetical protein